MRRPEPWERTGRGWYVQMDGRQIPLGADKDEAYREYHRLMAASGDLTPDEMRASLVPEVIEAFLELKSSMRASTLRAYRYHLQPFADAWKARKFGAIRPADVKKVIEGMDVWGESTRHVAFNLITAVWRWARDAGYIPANPMAGQENPYLAGRREQGVSLEEFDKMLAATPDPQFRLVLIFLRDVGSRPAEMRKLEARHLHPTKPVAMLQPAEHKTGRRSGKVRFLVIPEHLMTELRKLAVVHPEGPLLRNTIGTGWQENTLCMRFRRLREKCGLPKTCVPYGGRHGFATDLLSGKHAELPIASKVMGHSHADVIQSVYFHPHLDEMIEAVQLKANAVLARPKQD